MRAPLRIILLGLAIMVIAAGTAVAGTKLNAYSLQGQFICVSCHEPLNQVNSVEAQDEKSALSELVAQGLDFSQIKAKMVAFYGEGVLARPPAQGLNLLIYILPPVVLISGLAFLAYSLPRWRRRGRTAAAREAAVEPTVLDPVDEQRLDEELSKFDV